MIPLLDGIVECMGRMDEREIVCIFYSFVFAFEGCCLS